MISFPRIILMYEGTLKLAKKMKKSLDFKNRYEARSPSGGSLVSIYQITCSGGRETQHLQSKLFFSDMTWWNTIMWGVLGRVRSALRSPSTHLSLRNSWAVYWRPAEMKVHSCKRRSLEQSASWNNSWFIQDRWDKANYISLTHPLIKICERYRMPTINDYKKFLICIQQRRRLQWNFAFFFSKHLFCYLFFLKKKLQLT